MPRKTTANAVGDELLAEFQTLVAGTEKLLQNTAGVAGNQAEEAHSKIRDSLKHARDTLCDAKDSLRSNVRERSQVVVDATEVHVGEHSQQSIGIAAGVGFLLGLLVSRC